MDKLQTLRRAALIGAVSALPLASHAAIDVASVTAGIGEISTAVLAVLGAMLAVSVAVLGLSKVYAFVRRRAGA